MGFKPTDHILVPKHTKLSKEKKKQVLDVFHATLDQFPRILKSDPAIASLDPEIGDLIEVARNSQTAKDAKYYRVVVNG